MKTMIFMLLDTIFCYCLLRASARYQRDEWNEYGEETVHRDTEEGS